MDLSNGFRIANWTVGVIMILGAISNIIFWHDFPTIVECAYIIVFGLATIGLEFQIPPQVTRFASFMFSFLGRGVFYVFIGSILLDQHWTSKVAGSIVGICGVAYVVLEFLPQIEPPANMREADAGWGAEQV